MGSSQERYLVHKRSRRPGGCRCAFTLIELLVVIAIIAVLLAVLLPGLGYSRMVARRIGCGGRLRQICVAWQAYLDDHQGRFYQGVNANLNYGGWRGLKNWAPESLREPTARPMRGRGETISVSCRSRRGTW
ncbi:MAG: type II secretion system protein [Sedimentisphaerales bacterium]|nr:type II secretion system protein [Sedimentisphaerales bacterium]